MATTEQTIDADMSELSKNLAVTVRIHHVNKWLWKIKLSSWLLEVTRWLVGWDIVIINKYWGDV